MSYRSIIETLIYVDHFRNIDLFQQGFYFVKFSFYYERDDIRVYSNPYSCYKAASKSVVNGQQQQLQSSRSIYQNPHTQINNSSSTTQLITQRVQPKLHNLKDHEINQNECSYSTNIFYIRYAEEKVEIGDCINFRTEIEGFYNQNEEDLLIDEDCSKKQNKFEDSKFYLKVELLFQEATEEQIKNPRAIKLDVNDTNLKKFQTISTKLYRVKNIANGLSEFYPIQFDALHFSTISITLHSALMDFKFRRQPLNDFKDGEVSYKTQENNLRVVRLKAHTKKSRQSKKQKKFQNLTEYLFADDKEDDECVGYIPIDIEAREIDKIHENYVQSLINMHEKLKIKYVKYLKVLPQEIYNQLIEEKQSKYQIEPPKLVITHEAQLQSYTNVPSPRKGGRQPTASLFQKLNTTIINKTKIKIEHKPEKYQSSSTTNKMSNQAIMMNHKVFQYLEQQQNHMSRDESILGLKVNNLDEICTKSKLDQISRTTDDKFKHIQIQNLRSSNILTRQQQNESIERQNAFNFRLDHPPQCENPQDTSFNMDISNILDENPMIRSNMKSAPTNTASQGCQFIQNSGAGLKDYYSKMLEEEPLCEGFDALPEPLTKTISTKNLHYQLTKQNLVKENYKITNNLPPLSKMNSNKKTQLQSKENKTIYIKQSKFSFVQNYSSKVLCANQNIQNLNQQCHLKPMKSSQPAVPSTRSLSQNVPMSPPRIDFDDNLNANDISTASINFSEQKKNKGLSIPYIQVNQRNLQLINSSKSYLGIFQQAIKGHHEPQHITKILDSEVRQISVQIFQLWHQLINIYCCDPITINKSLKTKHQKNMYKTVSQIVIKNNECNFTQTTKVSIKTTLDSTQKTVNKRSNGSINEIRQFHVAGGMGLNNMHSQNYSLNTQRASSLSKSQLNSKNASGIVTPNIQSFKHKMSHHNLMSQVNFNSQNIDINKNMGSIANSKNLAVVKRNLSSQYNTIDDDFDLPNSPTKIVKAKIEVEDLRKKIQNQKIECKGQEKNYLSIIETEKKFRHEYEPLIVEEKYTKKGNQYDKSLTRPTSQLSTGSDKLQNTMITDLFKNLLVDDKSKKHLNKQPIGQHLFVFVHGFQASSYDMRAIKNQVSVLLPKAFCLCSQINENFTEGSIEQMGLNLANEVKKFIKEWCYSRDGKTLFLKKLTFIGHSLGGLIIRTALPSLEEFKDYMHGYMSLGSPHLGYMYNTNSLIDAGMWVLKRWKKSQCLQQLSMTDATNKNDTFLYKLSNYQGLNWFKQIIFCSSYQDNYAPHDSARIQICSRAAKQDREKGNSLYVNMAQNILDKIKCENMYRLDINFKIDEKNLDAMIGRTAHILLLECEPLIEALVNRYNEFFCE